MRLFYVPRTRATRPRWLLEELELPYELVRLDPSKKETHSAEHVARQPLGHVPALETKDGPLFESAALCLHLADLAPEKKLIAPVGSHARGLTYQWAFYGMCELEPVFIPLSREKAKKDAADPARVAELVAQAAKLIGPVERALGDAPFILGGEFSVADVVLGSVLAWGERLGGVSGEFPKVLAWLGRLKARPAFQRSVAD